MLIESPDVNLACTPGQNWVLGLMRADHLAGTGQWQAYSENPVVQNLDSTAGCAIQYQHLIEDKGDVFVYFGYEERGGRNYPNKLFKIVPGPGTSSIRFKSSVVPPNPAGLPAGSYLRSCDSCSFTNQLLKCSCKNTSNVSVNTDLNLNNCALGTDIANINGQLTCGLRP